MVRLPVTYTGPGPKLVGVLLVGYGLLRLGVLGLALAGLPAVDLAAVNLRILMLSAIEQGLIAGAPMVAGIAILRRRQWAWPAGAALCAVGILLDIYGPYLAARQAPEGGALLLPYDWLIRALWIGIAVQTAAIVVLVRNRRSFDLTRLLFAALPETQAILPTAPFWRAGAVVLIVAGIAQILFPLSSMLVPGSVWLVAAWWGFAVQGVPVLDPVGLLSYIAAAAMSAWSCGLGQASVAVGVGILSQRRWARPVGIVVCAFGLWIHLSALIAGLPDPMSKALAVTYLLAFAIGLTVVVRFRVRASEPGRARWFRRAESLEWTTSLIAMLRSDGVTQPLGGGSIKARSSRVALTSIIVGPIIAGVAGGIAATGAPTFRQPDNTPIVAFLLVLAPSVIITLLNLSGLRFMRPPSAIEELERASSRRPILYLRPFALDKHVSARFPDPARRSIGSRDTLPEEQIVGVLRKAGPVIALGHAGDFEPDLGAARFSVRDDVWYRYVTGIAQLSRLVILVTGLTEGLRSEIAFLTTSLPLDRLILCPHPLMFALTDVEAEREWAQFRETLGGLFPKPLPARLESICLIHFAADGTPLPVENSGLSRFGGYARATRAILMAKAIPPWDRAGRIRRGLVFALALLLAATAIAFREQFWSAVTSLGADRSIIPF